MTLQEIIVFVAIYEEGSITKAAQRLNMTQPGVSKTLSNIESRYNETLFVRDHRRISPTPICLQCYEACQKVLKDVKYIDSLLEHEESKKRVTIACDKALNGPLMPKVRDDFSKAFPNCRLVINGVRSDDIIDLIKSGDCDLGITQAACTYPGIEHENLGNDKIICVCSPSYNVRSRKRVLSLEDIAKEDLILTTKGSGIRVSLNRIAESKNIQFDPIWTCVGGEDAKSFAEQGYGIVMLSDTFSFESRREGKLRILPTDFTIQRFFNIVWRSDLWESAEERFLKESCKKHWIRMKQEQEAFNSQLH
ncbi:MAG: LysR family transcriptional regulator [Spirochaetales bacterium]|nr:LysR family transcriptional regulator [Spirochaetales bacterium]